MTNMSLVRNSLQIDLTAQKTASILEMFQNDTEGGSLPMSSISRFPTKVKLLLELEYPLIDQLLPRKGFIGGRIGYAKPLVFKWLLVKKVTNWAYRTITELSGISHQTFIRRNQDFLAHQVYQQFFQHLVRKAVSMGLIRGIKVALDSSFIPTYSSKREVGSEGWIGCGLHPGNTTTEKSKTLSQKTWICFS